MSVKTVNRKYKEIFTDGVTDWLLANVGEWQEKTLQVEVSIEYQATQQEPIQIDYVNNAFKLGNGKSWGEYGMDAGMTVVFNYKYYQDTNNDGNFETVTTHSSQYTISNTYSNVMEVVQPITAEGFENIPIDYGTKKIAEVLLYVDKIPEGAKVKFTHLLNEDYESQSLNSFIDGTTTEFGFANLPALQLGQWGDMEAYGMQSGMSVRSAKIRRISTSDNGGGTMIKYVNNGNPNLVISSRKGIVFKMNKISSGYPLYKNVTEDSLFSGTYPNYTNSAFNQCFLTAGSNYVQQLSIVANARLVSTVDIASNDYVALSIIEFNTAGFTFSSRTELKRWNNASSLVGSVLNYGNDIYLNVQNNKSYALAFEYFHPASPIGTGVILQIQNVEILGGFPNMVLSGGHKKFYEIYFKYMVSSLFENISDFENMTMPEYLQGDGSLTDNEDIRFFPEWNNPNLMIKNDLSQTKRLGNTGWFNENYNQLPNDFSIDSVKYFDMNGNQVDSIDYTLATKVKVIISGVPNLNTSTECGFGFAWIPTDENEYKNKTTPFYQNTFVQSGSLENGFKLNQTYSSVNYGAGINGGSMDTTSVRFSSQDGKIIFEADFVPNSSFAGIFDLKNENDRNYILWVSVADSSLTRNFSDRVSLIADRNNMVKNIPPVGAYKYIDAKFIEHPYDEDNAGVSVYDGFVQDDLLVRLPFRIPRDGSVKFRKLRLGVEAFNLSTNDDFALERYDIDLTQYPTDSNGIQQIDFDQSRGFKLNQGNNKNLFRVKREPQMDTTDFVGYIAYFGTKIRWEDWLINQNTPQELFNPSQPNNGFTNDWIAYIMAQGWTVNFFTEIEAESDSSLVIYKNQWIMKFDDYDSNNKIAKSHRYYRNSDNTLINVGIDPETGKTLGVVLFNEPTRIEVSFSILDEGIWNIGATYAVLTLEIDKGEGRFSQRQISSVYPVESDNPLRPLPGFQNLKLTVDGTQKILTASCLIDPDLIEQGSRYRITCREGCKTNDGNVFDPRLYEFRYEDTYE